MRREEKIAIDEKSEFSKVLVPNVQLEPEIEYTSGD